MCGIMASVGFEDSSNYVLKGLKNLEYRGYDSWGVASIRDNEIKLQKESGKISDAVLSDNLKGCFLSIGHTRWATHGSADAKNAHPHLSKNKQYAIVHNGIIENYQKIKNDFIKKEVNFVSETDTEVIIYLIEDFLSKGFSLLESIKEATKILKGRYAFAIIDSKKEKIFATRKGSPIIVGIHKKGYFLASDIPAFLATTNIVNYVDDNEFIEISRSGVKFYDKNLSKINKRNIELDLKLDDQDKGDYKHFMIKEINQQKETIRKAANQNHEEVIKIAEYINKAKGTFLIGCGTAHKMAMIGEYFFSRVTKKHINSVIAGEFPIMKDFLKKDSLVIAISQSGETADVLEALEIAKKSGAKVLSIVNNPASNMESISDFCLKINVGTEKAVASTKAATGQMVVLLLLAFACSGDIEKGEKLLIDVSSKINDMLNPRFINYIESVAETLIEKNNMFIIGKGANYPISLESAIKIQEVSYINAQGFAASELKHGHIAMIEKDTPCIVFINDSYFSKEEILSSAIEVKSRGGKIIGISSEKYDVFDEWIKIPESDEANPIINLIPIQLLSYFLSIKKGYNPDQPRNLAKSVTVK